MEKNSWIRALALISQLGFVMAIPIILCIFAGTFLDNKFGTSPWFLFIFSILGIGAAFRNLFYLAGKKKNDEKSKGGKKDE